jgi:hypothetical protein
MKGGEIKMIFDCEIKTSEETEEWEGVIESFNNYGSHSELYIKSRSNIFLIFGKTSKGGFACIPDFQVGCHLANFSDKFWNTEKLTAALGIVDGITVANALYYLSKAYPEL